MSCKDNYGRLRVAAAVGVTSDTMERVQALVDAGVDAVIVSGELSEHILDILEISLLTNLQKRKKISELISSASNKKDIN